MSAAYLLACLAPGYAAVVQIKFGRAQGTGSRICRPAPSGC